MKYVSIDIETTGLDPAIHSMIEFAAVIDDLVTPIEDLPKFRALINPGSFTIDPYCAILHQGLFREMLDNPNDCVIPFRLRADLTSFIKHNWGDSPVIAAGKNFKGFDEKFIAKLDLPFRFSHRSLDPAPLYLLTTDNDVPSLQTCLDRAGIQKSVSHTALDDAMDVIRLLRHKLVGQ